MKKNQVNQQKLYCNLSYLYIYIMIFIVERLLLLYYYVFFSKYILMRELSETILFFFCFFFSFFCCICLSWFVLPYLFKIWLISNLWNFYIVSSFHAIDLIPFCFIVLFLLFNLDCNHFKSWKMIFLSPFVYFLYVLFSMLFFDLLLVLFFFFILFLYDFLFFFPFSVSFWFNFNNISLNDDHD